MTTVFCTLGLRWLMSRTWSQWPPFPPCATLTLWKTFSSTASLRNSLALSEELNRFIPVVDGLLLVQAQLRWSFCPLIFLGNCFKRCSVYLACQTPAVHVHQLTIVVPNAVESCWKSLIGRAVSCRRFSFSSSLQLRPESVGRQEVSDVRLTLM